MLICDTDELRENWTGCANLKATSSKFRNFFQQEVEGRLQHLDTGTQINTVSIEIQVSQVEPVKPAKCSESINPAHVRHGEIEFSRRLIAIS